MAMKKGVSEILKEADKTQTVEGKIAVLKHYETDTFKLLLRLAFDPNVKWLLPPGAPPYKSTDAANDVQGRLFTEVRRFYLFVEGGNPPPPAMPTAKREGLFIQLLESLDPDDAKLLVAIKDKELTSIYKTVTPNIINQAFPALVYEAPTVEIKKDKKKSSKKLEPAFSGSLEKHKKEA